MDTMIAMHEVLEMIDEKYNYAQDELAKKMFAERNNLGQFRHLIDRRMMLKYFDYYAAAKGKSSYLDVINTNGMGTRGAKYNKKDIKRIINHPDIARRIQERFEKITLPGPEGPVPKCIYHDYIEEYCGEDDNKILAINGYTVRQNKLFSVPSELLIERKDQLEDELSSLREKQSELQSELDDVVNELETRGIN